MPEATPRTVEYHDTQTALQLLDAAGQLITRGAASNNLPVQEAVNSMVVDLVVYAKQLLKTPPPPEPESLTAKAAE
jgi:hypothetical protein